MQVAYEYRGLKASTWDLFLGQTVHWEDTLFFRELIGRYGQPTLEVGCGTGRLLLDYMAAGIDIDGVDNSPEMLAICRRKAQQRGLQPVLFQQSMERLNLPRQYRLIIIPASSFQVLTDPVMAQQAIKRFWVHLEAGGWLAIRFMILWQEGDPLQTDWRLIGEKTRPEDGVMVRHWSRASYEVENQLEHIEERYELLRYGEIIATEHHRCSPANRWYMLAQALSLYEAAGFTDFSEVDEQNASLSNSVKELIFTVIGRKPW